MSQATDKHHRQQSPIKNKRKGIQFMHKLFFLYFLFSFTLSAKQVEQSESIKFEPANFKDTKFSLQNLIRFPSSKAESDKDFSALMQCEAQISRTGRFLYNFCFGSKGEYRLFYKKIERAAKKAKIKPGRVNGIAKKVWFQYFIVFTKKKGQLLIEGFPNSGLQVEQYGVDYTSAQRYRENDNNFGSLCKGTRQTVKAIINKFGVTESVQVEGKNTGERCKNQLIKSFMKMNFIPAFANGKAVASFYSEDIYNRPKQY